MSDDNLESLDNASLRKKCLEYGLPNVPITDTSRKLLIRKLRTAISGETDEKKKNRRETIHVTKIPTLSETNANATTEEPVKRPPSRANRRTIAATSVTSTVDDTSLPVTKNAIPVVDRRRSVKSQPEKQPETTIPISQKRKTAAVLEEEEDDDDDVILLEAAEQSERETEIVIPRTRRSVSLSKTGVVTTSYSQEKTITPPTMNETESESENEFVTKYSNLYAPISRPLVQPQPVRETIYNFSQPKVPNETDRISSFSTTSVNRTSIEPETVYKPNLAKPEIVYKPNLSTSRYSSLGSGYTTTAGSSVTTSTTRRFTTGGYGGTPSNKYTTMYGDDNEDEENEGETPYLSDFARKLERLKAEPLVKGVESPRSVPLKREPNRYPSSIVGRRSTSQTDSVADSFKNFLYALDRKYKLKRNFSILFVVILLLFIYIVFIQ